MALLGTSNKPTLFKGAKDALVHIMQTNKSVLNKDFAHAMIGIEALSDPSRGAEYVTGNQEVVNMLSANEQICQYVDKLADNMQTTILCGDQRKASVGLESLKQSFKEDTFQRIAMAVISQMNPAETIKRYSGNCPESADVRVAHTFGGFASLPGLDNPSLAPGMLSFDPVQHLDFIAASALINAQTSTPGGFEEVFFPTISLPPAQSGFDVLVQVPKILQTRTRLTDGNPLTLQKINLVEASYNPSVLNSNSIKIVPVVIDAVTPSQLCTAAQVANTTVQVLDTQVTTRPIVFNKSVGLIELSTIAAITNGASALDTTDALYTNIGIENIYFRLSLVTGTGGTATTVAVTVKNNVKNVVGTLLQQKTLGRQQSFQTVTDVPLYYTNTSVSVGGNDSTIAQFNTAVTSALGLTAGTSFTISSTVRISAQADTEIASMNVDATQATITGVFGDLVNGGVQPIYSLAAITTPNVANMSISMIGWDVDARRTNSNLRTNGTIIDTNNNVFYRLAINLFPPFTARTPINQTDQITYEMFANVTNLWTNGQCVDKLLAAEDYLRLVSGTPMGVGTKTNQCPLMGGEFVIPTFREDNVDLATMVSNFQSKDTLANVRAAIQTSLMYVAAKLYMDSGYASALQVLLSDLDAYEVIIVTDPLIARYLMEPGDIRTFGDNVKYIITKSMNQNLRGKIYYSFRLMGNSDVVHPMTFGCKLVSPNVTYEVTPMNRNGANMREIQSMPRVSPYVNLPVLGKLNVLNLDTFTTSGQLA